MEKSINILDQIEASLPEGSVKKAKFLIVRELIESAEEIALLIEGGNIEEIKKRLEEINQRQVQIRLNHYLETLPSGGFSCK